MTEEEKQEAVLKAVPSAREQEIRRLCDNIVSQTLGQPLTQQSMLREAVNLTLLIATGVDLSLEQKDTAKTLININAWEGAMVARRTALIAMGDKVTDADLIVWPTPPDGIADFIKYF